MMKDSEKAKEKKSFIKKILFNPVAILEITANITAVLGFFIDKELPWKLFLMLKIGASIGYVVLLTLIVECVIKNIRKYFKKEQKLNKKAKNDNELKRRYSFDVSETKKECKRNTIKGVLPKVGVGVTIYLSMQLVYWTNPNNVQAANNVVDYVINVSGKTGDDEEEIYDIENQNDEGTEEINVSKPDGYRFILVDLDRAPKLQEEIINTVFFYEGEEDNKLVLKGQVSYYFDDLLARKKDRVELAVLEDKFDKAYLYYEEKQGEFESKMAEAELKRYLDEFTEVAPRSTDLDECIEGRTKLNSIEVNGNRGNPKLWWRLANDYQNYALEYENQTTNDEAILYYYAMSIYCCMEALQYDFDGVTGVDYETIYNYMQMRYRDIARNESLVESGYKMRAKEILSELDDYNRTIYWGSK